MRILGRNYGESREMAATYKKRSFILQQGMLKYSFCEYRIIKRYWRSIVNRYIDVDHADLHHAMSGPQKVAKSANLW